MKRPAAKRVLVVSAAAHSRESLRELLRRASYDVVELENPARAGEVLRQQPFDVVVVGTTGRTSEGLLLLDELHQRRMRIPVIYIGDVGDVDLYLDAMNRGAFEYLVVPLSEIELLTTVRKALEWSPRRRRAA